MDTSFSSLPMAATAELSKRSRRFSKFSSSNSTDNTDMMVAPSSITVSTRSSTTLSAGPDYDEHDDCWMSAVDESVTAGMYASVTQKMFPYHIVVDSDCQIVAMGNQLARILRCSREDIMDRKLNEVLSLDASSGQEKWTWKWLCEQDEDQSFRVRPAKSFKNLRFKANAIHVSQDTCQAMINMVPDASVTDDLKEMSLKITDMPAHGAYRTSLKLQEKLNGETRKRADVVSTLCKSLAKEKTLLESLIPTHVAKGLRRGENVEPRLHQNVTFFFSDVVGFTDMCKQLYPWQVTNMLNRLYCVMDYLAGKCDLFKVETIGDAYVCCSGIPESDENHAQKVANFAIAVSHCVRRVLSPVDGSPIQLRIGVHTGSAASGVVGVTNPRYCVFGDTVNVTARHEGSGEAGRVHLSAVTHKALMGTPAGENFSFIERGLIEMKGKGQLRTFWLESSEMNPFVNKEGMAQLEMEIDDLLQQNKFENEMERRTTESSLALMGKLGEGQLSDKNQEMLGPVLDIIRKELNGRSRDIVRQEISRQSQGTNRSKQLSRAKSDESMNPVSWHSGDKKKTATPIRSNSLDTCTVDVAAALPVLAVSSGTKKRDELKATREVSQAVSPVKTQLIAAQSDASKKLDHDNDKLSNGRGMNRNPLLDATVCSSGKSGRAANPFLNNPFQRRSVDEMIAEALQIIDDESDEEGDSTDYDCEDTSSGIWLSSHASLSDHGL